MGKKQYSITILFIFAIGISGYAYRRSALPSFDKCAPSKPWFTVELLSSGQDGISIVKPLVLVEGIDNFDDAIDWSTYPDADFDTVHIHYASKDKMEVEIEKKSKIDTLYIQYAPEWGDSILSSCVSKEKERAKIMIFDTQGNLLKEDESALSIHLDTAKGNEYAIQAQRKKFFGTDSVEKMINISFINDSQSAP